MTVTTLAPSGSAVGADRTLRLLSIAADLLPVEIVAARRGRKVRRFVVAALVVFAALLMAWYGGAARQASVARNTLATAEADAQQVVQRQHAFDEVVRTRAESQAINAQLSELLGSDLPWSRLLSSVQRAALPGVQVTGITGAVTAKTELSAGAAATDSRLPNTSGQRQVGTVTVTGTGTGKALIAAYVDALAKLPGLGNPLLAGVTLQDGVLEFTVRLDITHSVLGGRHTAKSNEGSGDN